MALIYRTHANFDESPSVPWLLPTSVTSGIRINAAYIESADELSEKLPHTKDGVLPLALMSGSLKHALVEPEFKGRSRGPLSRCGHGFDIRTSQALEIELVSHSTGVWSLVLEPAMNARISIRRPPGASFKYYLSRPVRHYVSSTPWLPGIEHRRRQMTIFIPISKSLETVISTWGCPQNIQLIPVHNFLPDESYATRRLLVAQAPSTLQDSEDPEEPNLRFWLPKEDDIYAGLDARVDDVRGILQCIAAEVDEAADRNRSAVCDRGAMTEALLRHVRRQLQPLMFSHGPFEPVFHGQLQKREKQLLQSWLANWPIKTKSTRDGMNEYYIEVPGEIFEDNRV